MRGVLASVGVAALMVGAGCGGSGGPSAGSQCSEVLTVFCGRAVDCQVFPADQMQECVSAGLATCCGSSCGVAVTSTEAEIRACGDAIKVESCTDIAMPVLPDNCFHVVQTFISTAPTALVAQPVSGPMSRLADIGAKMSSLAR